MSLRLNIRLFLPLACLAPLLLALPASALTLADASWPEMLSWADCVVAARVESVRSEPNGEPGAHGVCTRVRLADIRWLAGPDRPAVIDVLLPGGALNGRRVNVPGAPRFRIGEDVVLFLRHPVEAESRKPNPPAPFPTREGGELHGSPFGEEYCLCGYGLGVLRQRGESFVPDIAVDGGPPAQGESLPAFYARFGAAASQAMGADALIRESGPGWLIYVEFAAGIAALTWAALRRRRRRWKRAAAILVISLEMAGAVSNRICADVPPVPPNGPFTYVLEGPKWDLYQPLIDRVSGARILWFQGKGTKDLSDATAFDTIRAAFQKWEDVPDSAVAFTQAGVTIDAGTADDERNTISFMTKPPKALFDKKTLAVTFMLGNADNTYFTDTDTVFNDRDVMWAQSGQRYSLDVVALHEIGHFIGLAHSMNIADVMYPVAQGTSELSVSDAAGASALYPLAADIPAAIASACPTLGAAPLTVAFSAALSNPGAGRPLSVQWDFGDGAPASTDPNPQHTYAGAGAYTATLTLPGTTAAPSQIAIQALAASTPVRIENFQFQASFASKGNAAKLTLTLSGLSVSSSDAIQINLGPVSFSVPANSSTAKSSLGGLVALQSNAQKSALTLKLTGAHLGRSFDLRDPASTAQSGTVSLPLNIVATHSAGGVSLFTAALKFQYQIKSTRSGGGILERSMQGRLAP